MLSNRQTQTFLTLIFLLIVSLMVSAPMQAQEGASSPATTSGVSPDVTADEVNEVARELWCPLCDGVRLDGCELKACDQMKDEIAIKLSDGEDSASIKQYFVNQYGPQVLGEPPREGFNLLAWILPVLVMLGGGVFLITRGRSMIRRDDPDAVAAAPSVPTNDADGDPYARRLEEELKAYD